MNLNRRNFLFGSAAAMTLAGCATNKIGLRPLKPGEKRNVAMIGIGIQGRFLLSEFLGQKNVRVTCICDCDKTRREDGAKRVDGFYKDGSKCAAVADFRDVLRDPAIDAVCIATPVDWDGLIPIAEADGVKWWVVECERHFNDLSAVTPSYAFLKAKGLN